jgi:hypothetical protein
MKRGIIWIFLCLTCCLGYADDTTPAGPEAFVRQAVQSLVDGGNAIPFPVADTVVALDNGEVLSRADFQKAWPQFAKEAFKRKVTVDQFFKGAELKIGSPLENKRLMGNKRVLESYTYQDGDLYIDASQVKAGAENVIDYDKAFIYLIRQIGGQWTLVGVGG